MIIHNEQVFVSYHYGQQKWDPYTKFTALSTAVIIHRSINLFNLVLFIYYFYYITDLIYF